MNEERIQKAIASTTEAVNGYVRTVDSYTDDLRPAIRFEARQLRDEVDIKIASCEAHIIRLTGIISQNANYHIISAYFHASPGLWAIIIGILEVVKIVLDWISIINDLLVAITDQNLLYWLNKLIPGFENAWNSILHKISTISQKLGWGVDGISHLLNAFNIGTDAWGAITGKSDIGVRTEKMTKTQSFLNSLSGRLEEWENVPGIMFNDLINSVPSLNNFQSHMEMHNIQLNLGKLGHDARGFLTSISDITSELGALREDMPSFIADHIPQGLWDGIDRVQKTIDEGILPVLTDVMDRIAEVNAVLESYRERAEALAESLNNPGDLLERIEALSEQARLIQAGKLDKYSGEMMNKKTGDVAAGFETEDRILDALHELMSVPIPEPSFLALELAPGSTHPEITVEPHETWFAGDY